MVFPAGDLCVVLYLCISVRDIYKEQKEDRVIYDSDHVFRNHCFRADDLLSVYVPECAFPGLYGLSHVGRFIRVVYDIRPASAADAQGRDTAPDLVGKVERIK